MKNLEIRPSSQQLQCTVDEEVEDSGIPISPKDNATMVSNIDMLDDESVYDEDVDVQPGSKKRTRDIIQNTVSEVQKGLESESTVRTVAALHSRLSRENVATKLEPTDCLDAERLLQPVSKWLEKLRKATPDSLPSYSRHTRSKEHAQVVKAKLLPVGRHIVEHLASIPEEGRGAEELRLCRYIAERYWPLPVSSTTHLRILETYRNALYASHES